MLNFTDSQKKAIETAGKSLVVSAGAGSGKTTVLTQRIINKILSGTDIDDILVVTFTRAAAADLKEKLYCSLSAESAKDVENTRLSDMLFKVSSAKISTISSFCLELVRSNFAILGLSPSLRVADDIESKIMLGECLANCIDDFFEKEDADFLLLADNFGGEKSLKTLEEMIISIYLRMRAEPFWHASMISACKSHEIEAEKCKNEGYFATDEGKMFKKNTLLSLDILLKKANKLYDYAAQVSVSEANIYPLACLSESIDKICKKNYSSYDGLKASLLTFESPRINTKGIEKVAAEYIKSEKAAIKSRFDEIIKAFVFSESDIYNDYIKTINLNKSIKKVIFELDRVYIFEKNKRGICDFSDAEQLSLKLLCEKTESVILRSNVCQKVRNSFAEIYIDEYQDINRLQDMIFSLISKPENRFCVGDSKQSIYRFRAAEAEIFSNYIKSCNELPNDEVKAKIYLSENFRSSKSIIDYVNLIFEKLYTVQNVGIDYSNEKLICASLGTIDYPVQTTVFYNGESGEKSVGEAEANYIVSEIQKLHNGGVKYSDIAIICRSISGTYDAEKEFVKNKIPYYIEKDSEFLLKPEITLAVSILKIIDNPTDDISLFSALRSPVFLFNAEEIYKIKSFYPYDSLLDCIYACENEYKRKFGAQKFRANKSVENAKFCGKRKTKIKGTRNGKRPTSELLSKVNNFILILQSLRTSASEETSYKLVWKMFEKTKLLFIAACEKNGDEKKQNLLMLYRMAINFEKSSFKGISSFLGYLSEIADSFSSSEKGGFENETVKIMTIHKSKGLEFEVCFVCGTGKRFNIDDMTAKFIKSRDSFYYFNVRANENLSEYVPIIKKGASIFEKQAMLCEELRCLYVAITRAKKRLYVTGCVKKAETDKNPPFFTSNSYLEWILSALDENNDSCFNLSFFDSDMNFDILSDTEKNIDDTDDCSDIGTFDYRYQFTESTKISAKVAVSELRKGIFEDDEYTRSVSGGETLAKPIFIKESVTGAERGNATHLFMQFCNFKNITQKGVEFEAKRLFDIKMITNEQFSLLNIKAIKEFFNSNLYESLKNSKKLYREKRFTLAESSDILVKGSDEQILVQGVIDCFFENSDGTYTVLDYKTDSLPKIGGEEILKKRHLLQLKYYCRAVEMITGKKVSKAVLYSFSLGKEIEITNIERLTLQ